MIAAVLIIVLGSWGALLFFPWWTLVIPCFIAGMMGPDRGFKAFAAGVLGVGGLWLILALVADIQNSGVLTSSISDLMKLPGTFLLYVITIAIGSLTGGMACLSGYLVLGRGR